MRCAGGIQVRPCLQPGLVGLLFNNMSWDPRQRGPGWVISELCQQIGFWREDRRGPVLLKALSVALLQSARLPAGNREPELISKSRNWKNRNHAQSWLDLGQLTRSCRCSSSARASATAVARSSRPLSPSSSTTRRSRAATAALALTSSDRSCCSCCCVCDSCSCAASRARARDSRAVLHSVGAGGGGVGEQSGGGEGRGEVSGRARVRVSRAVMPSVIVGGGERGQGDGEGEGKQGRGEVGEGGGKKGHGVKGDGRGEWRRKSQLSTLVQCRMPLHAREKDVCYNTSAAARQRNPRARSNRCGSVVLST